MTKWCNWSYSGWNMRCRTWSRYARIPKHFSLDDIDMVSCFGKIFITTNKSVYRLQGGVFTEICTFSNSSGSRARVEYHRPIVHKDLIYIINHICLIKFNPKTFKYTTVRVRLPINGTFRLAASDTHIYAVEEQTYTDNQAFEMKFSDETWEGISVIPSVGTSHSIFWYKSNLYAICDWLICYEPRSDSWRKVGHNKSDVKSLCKALQIGNDVYVVGSDEGISRLDIPNNNSRTIWSRTGLHPSLACVLTE